jgi:hypothetical protein
VGTTNPSRTLPGALHARIRRMVLAENRAVQEAVSAPDSVPQAGMHPEG